MNVVVDVCNQSAHIDERCSYLALSEVASAQDSNNIDLRCMIKIPCSQT